MQLEEKTKKKLLVAGFSAVLGTGLVLLGATFGWFFIGIAIYDFYKIF